MVVAQESLRLYSLMEKERPDQCLGKKSITPHSLQLMTGEMLMVLTIVDGTKTNTSQFIVDHAGLKVPHQHLETDSIFSTKITSQHQLILTLKLWSTVMLEVHAM